MAFGLNVTGDLFVFDLASHVSSAFAALTTLFDECLHDVWTLLLSEQSERLAKSFTDTLASLLPKLDTISFGISIFSSSGFSLNAPIPLSASHFLK